MPETICKKCRALLPDTFQYCPCCGRPVHPVKRAKRYRPHGFGSVYRLSGNRSRPWTAVVKGEYLGYWETEMEAQTYLNGWVSRQTTATANYTLAQVRSQWMESQRYKKLSKDAKNNYAAAWARLEMLAEQKVRVLKTADYQKAIQLALEQGCGYETCNKIRSLVSLLCQEAMKTDTILQNYAKGLELPEHTAAVKRNFSDEDILKLFYADGDRDARIVLCIIYSGVRAGELFGVLKSSVDLSDGYMVGGSKTEAGINRVIPIRQEIMPYIRGFMEEPGEYLITSSRGKRMDRNNFSKRRFYPLLDRLGIPYRDENGKIVLTLGRGRHTFIAAGIESGMAPEALAKIVGHTQYSTSVNKYGDRLSVEYLKKEAQKGL